MYDTLTVKCSLGSGVHLLFSWQDPFQVFLAKQEEAEDQCLSAVQDQPVPPLLQVERFPVQNDITRKTLIFGPEALFILTTILLHVHDFVYYYWGLTRKLLTTIN